LTEGIRVPATNCRS